MEHLTGPDATFIYTETAKAPFEISALLVMDPPQPPPTGEPFEGRARFEAYKTQLWERLHLVPRFRQIVKRVPFDLDHPIWVDDPDFDLDYHVRHSGLPEPGDQATLEALIGRLLSTPLDHRRPLWETYVIEGLANGQSALLIKTHHALMDGVAGFNTIGAMVDLEPYPTDPRSPAEPWAPRKPPHAAQLLVGVAANSLRAPVRNLQTATKLMGDLISSRLPGKRSASEVLGASLAPPSPFNTVLRGPRRVRLFEIDLAQVQAVRAGRGATINDVALTLIGGAVRRYLQRREELAEESLLTYMPIAVKSADGEPLAGNATTVIAAKLRTDLADPGERLAAVAKETAAAKQRAVGEASPLIMDLSAIAPVGVAAALERLGVAGGMTAKLRLAGNVVVSNIASVPVDLFTLGSLVSRMVAIGVISDGVGLSFTVLGYRGQLQISVLADDAAVPDIDTLVADLHEEWDAFSRLGS